MIYKTFQDEKLSMFAMGCMRLPVIDGSDSAIDQEHVQSMVDYALEHGMNYFDTAWGYHGGNSERVMGTCLSRHARSSFNLADKFPGYDLENMGKTPEIFEEQLKKCQVDYFDFYLIHNVCERNINEYLDDEKYGTVSYLLEQKKAGRIRHLGFSNHGNLETLRRFLDAYGSHMEFCQLQLNYFDYTFQDTKAKMELAQTFGLPIWVMEPLRGGSLCTFSDVEQEELARVQPAFSPVEWAFRWLQSQPEVAVVLSGSSSLAQMKENIALFEQERPLTLAETEALQTLVDNRLRGNVQPCTKCRYCVSHCPQELDIPWLLELYNEEKVKPSGFLVSMALAALDVDKKPENCIACGSCSQVCPQQIDIPGVLARFVQMLG